MSPYSINDLAAIVISGFIIGAFCLGIGIFIGYRLAENK